MWGWLRRFLNVASASVVPTRPVAGFFSTDLARGRTTEDDPTWLREMSRRVFQRTAADLKIVAVKSGATTFTEDGAEGSTVIESVAMDESDLNFASLKDVYALSNSAMSDVQADWYASQSFIGYQMCAMLAQNWLIDKACTMPARDAVRNGWEITVNDGTKIAPEVLDRMRTLDKLFKVKAQACEFIRKSRIFGIRIALFEVESVDPNYYTNPFNPDGVTPGSYKGISQVDPYWITPELDAAATRPGGLHFYVPTYWRINGKRYHRSHLVIIRTCDVPDVLKPTYLFGGIPLPQRIFERVYAAERTANEAPQLALSKRSTVISVDMDAAVANQAKFEDKLRLWAHYRDNYGVKFVGLNEKVEQFDTSLTDFDQLIMTQFQLVAAIAEVPATKLLGTTPKGFQSTGEYEQSNYHEMLESIQEHDVQPLLERHHLLCVRSFIVPEFKIPLFQTTVEFKKLDAETAKERAERQKTEAERDKALTDTGGIDGVDVRNRLIKDSESGFSGIAAAIPEGPRPGTVVDPGAQKTAPNAPTPAETQPPSVGAPGA